MYYVYVLKNERGAYYIGWSSDLRSRLRAHNDGQNASTQGHSWQLLYYEAYGSDVAARERERILKHDGRSRRALMDRINRDEK
jgi:putative endonuclease